MTPAYGVVCPNSPPTVTPVISVTSNTLNLSTAVHASAFPAMSNSASPLMNSVAPPAIDPPSATCNGNAGTGEPAMFACQWSTSPAPWFPLANENTSGAANASGFGDTAPDVSPWMPPGPPEPQPGPPI